MKKIILLSLISVLLLLPLIAKGQLASDLKKEYLFPISYGTEASQNDVIGLRIYQNPDNKDPLTWYLSNVSNPKSSLPAIKVDGYAAVRDDRTVYIQASNLVNLTTTRNFYTNIYVLAYNQSASPETVNIFNQMLANIKFNKNILDIYCLKAQGEAVKDGLRRDTVRKTDVFKLNRIFASATGLNLSAGTYVPGMSISTWPSWQATLGQQLGTALPTDPLNIMSDRLIACTADDQCATGQCSGGYCSACNPGYDARTCWNERELKYQRVDGFVYKYQNGVLTIRYEYPQILFPETGDEIGDCWLGCNKDGLYYTLGSCLPDNSYCAAAGWTDNVCGDDMVRCQEVCEGDNCAPGCLSCNNHYHAEGSLCVADTTDPLPVLTQTLSTAEEQRWTGDDWSAPYATACIANAVLDGVGVCHCKTNYHEEVVEGVSSCVPDSRWFTCDAKPEHTVWNTVGSYQQNWDGEKWVPLTPEAEFNPEFNEVPSNIGCRFIAEDGYHWTGSSSESNIGPDCALPAAATTENIWDSTLTTPDYVCKALTCVDHATLTAGNCACNTNYTWDGSICGANSQTVVCSDNPINSEWGGGTNISYLQTWDGNNWAPVLNPFYNLTATAACYFRCSSGFYYIAPDCNCGNGIIDGTEQCDGTAGIAASPADSLINNKQYACDDTCKFTGGYLGDDIVNGTEDCDPPGSIQSCDGLYSTTNTADVCYNDLVPSLQTCNDSGSWDACQSTTTRPTADQDGDGVPDACDNCADVKNPNQSNADGDSYGDMCDDCYMYNGKCVTLTAKQDGADAYDFQPFASAQSMVDFYGYADAKAHITTFSIVKFQRSEILGYLDTNTDPKKLGLIFVHGDGKDTAGGGGTVDFWIRGDFYEKAYIKVRDDNPDEFNIRSKDNYGKIPEGHWDWNKDKTDGAAFEMGDLNTGWSIYIKSENWPSADWKWFIIEPGPDGVEQGKTLIRNEAITITYTP